MTIELVTRFLGIGTLLLIGLMFLTFFIFLFARDWAYSIHSRWFDITRKEFDLIFYCFLGVMKLQVFILFLVPYVALKIMGH